MNVCHRCIFMLILLLQVKKKADSAIELAQGSDLGKEPRMAWFIHNYFCKSGKYVTMSTLIKCMEPWWNAAWCENLRISAVKPSWSSEFHTWNSMTALESWWSAAALQLCWSQEDLLQLSGRMRVCHRCIVMLILFFSEEKKNSVTSAFDLAQGSDRGQVPRKPLGLHSLS